MTHLRIDPTPNPNCLKVTVGRTLAEGRPLTYNDAASAAGNALVQALFEIRGVRSVFLFKDYCTITKDPDVEWTALEPQIEQVFLKHS